jgi:hypothetical protein
MESITHFENFANEIILEIFDYLAFYDIWKAFSNLNRRFENILTDPSFPIKINISLVSTSNFEDYYTNTIMINKDRIQLLQLSNPFSIHFILPSLYRISEFLRLKTLILRDMESHYIENLLQYSIDLPNLTSLTIIPINHIEDSNNLYHQLFRLPVLKYCKVLIKQQHHSMPLKIDLHQFSPITHLIISYRCNLYDLSILLSFVPHLRRLSCYNLLELSYTQIEIQSIILKNLTHLFIEAERLTFDQVELFISKLSHQLQVFHFSTVYDPTYLNADRWEQFILSYLPYIQIFNIKLFPNYDDDRISCHTSIDQFTSSFWSERRWFFTHEYYSSKKSLASFYSIEPYRYDKMKCILFKIFLYFRGKQYTLYNWIYQDTYPYEKNRNFNSVHHVSIKGKLNTINSSIYFPNTTELTIYDYIDQSFDSISATLDRIIPLIQLTKLNIQCQNFCFGKVIDLLYFSPNIQTLILNSISHTKINALSIQQSITFQSVSNTNKILNVRIEQNCTMENVKLIIELCPRLQYLAINIDYNVIHLFTEFLSLITNEKTRPLVYLCLLNIPERLYRMIRLGKLPDQYSVKFIDHNLHLWW